MREILFRGKRIDNGEWAFGNLVIQETDNSEVNFISNNETEVDVFIQPIKKVWDTHWNSFGRQEWKAVAPLLKVAPNNIGQYTGLKDKSGQMIFEGDIVEAVLPPSISQPGFVWPIMPVVFLEGAFGLADPHKEIIPFRSFAPTITFEVKGNIHDNPDLLKGE